MFLPNFDLNKLKETKVPTFLSKEDIKAIIDALEAKDSPNREVFKKQYTPERIKEVSDILLGKFSKPEGKTLFILDGITSTATSSLIMLPFVPDDQLKLAFENKEKELTELYETLLTFFKTSYDKSF